MRWTHRPARAGKNACKSVVAALAGAVAVCACAAARADDAPAATQDWAFHLQATSTTQYHPAFTSPYRGANSLDPGSRGSTTNDATAYVGVRPWAGGEVWLDPEFDQGFGLSDTEGVAGYTNGEGSKVGRSTPYFRLQRWFLRQTIDLGGKSQSVDADINQLAGSQTDNRLVLTVGKFSVVDVFDTNQYAHDARHDFLNWSIIDTGTYDYAADAWGYTEGAAAELYEGNWTGRFGLFALSKEPNGKKIDQSLDQFQYDAEVEHRHTLAGQPGVARMTLFVTRGRMGHFNTAIALAEATGQPANTALVRRYSSRAGVSLTIEQQVRDNVGLFVRAGWAEGDTEAYEYADIDRTVVVGASLGGALWGRKDDSVGAAVVDNGASEHRLAYLADGGLGILVGDGKLPHPGEEHILETYYSVPVVKVAHLTFDYQFIDNPAYNRDRGPVSVFSLRLHLQWPP